MEIVYSYMKLRRDFGRQPRFCEQGPEMCDSIVTNKAEHKHFILRNPVHELVQHGPVFSRHEINTFRAEYHTSGINHSEGGWAKDININDPEATDRYRRKIQKEDGYIHCVMDLAPGMEHYVMQNNAIDMYRTYYAEMSAWPPIEKNSVRTINVYRDSERRPITSISWQAERGERFAVSYADVDFYRTPHKSTSCFIWQIENANSPEVVLEPGCPMFDLQFNPRDLNLLVGGLATGQVAFWDRRTGGEPEGSCPPHVAHRDIVRKVIFIYTKSNCEFFSAGPDGEIKWWDTRNLSEPTDQTIMDPVKTPYDDLRMELACGVSVLEYESTIPTRFMCGTENGLILCGNRKGKTPMEKIPAKFEAHLGPVWSLQRNPLFPKNFLTVGDYTVKIWSDDCRESPILWSQPMRHRVTSGSWSPTRVSLCTLCGSDGKFALWDILRRQHEPVLTMQVCDDPLTTQCFQERGSLVGIGNSSGYVFMVELSQFLVDSGPSDKALLTQIFERETKRERILEARLREIRLKLRQAEEGSPVASLTDVDPTVGDRDLAEATQEFTSIVKKELASF